MDSIPEREVEETRFLVGMLAVDIFEAIVYGFGGVIAGLSVILLILLCRELPKEIRTGVCIECGTPRSLIHLPTRLRQVIRGGWICRECGFEMDGWGRRVAQQNTLAKWAVLPAADHAGRAAQAQPNPDERIQEANDQMQRGNAS